MKRAALLLTVLALAGCGGRADYVRVPSNHGKPLDVALRRLHEAGLRASFPAATTPCGDDLPPVGVQTPRAPASVRRGSVVRIRFGPSFVPSGVHPKRHARWTFVPDFRGKEWNAARRALPNAIWPCVHVAAAGATDAERLVVVRQRPAPGTRVPAYGVLVRRGYRPTTVDLFLAPSGT